MVGAESGMSSEICGYGVRPLPSMLVPAPDHPAAALNIVSMAEAVYLKYDIKYIVA